MPLLYVVFVFLILYWFLISDGFFPKLRRKTQMMKLPNTMVSTACFYVGSEQKSYILGHQYYVLGFGDFTQCIHTSYVHLSQGGCLAKLCLCPLSYYIFCS